MPNGDWPNVTWQPDSTTQEMLQLVVIGNGLCELKMATGMRSGVLKNIKKLLSET